LKKSTIKITKVVLRLRRACTTKTQLSAAKAIEKSAPLNYKNTPKQYSLPLPTFHLSFVLAIRVGGIRATELVILGGFFR